MKKVSKALKNYIVDGIALIVLGLILMIWSEFSLLALFKWIGIALIVIGGFKGVLYFLKNKKEQSLISLIVGVLQIAAGIALIVKSGTLTQYFPIVAAVILCYGAIMMIFQALKLRDRENKAFTVSFVLSLISLILAVIVFVHPAVLIDVMMQASGAAMIFEGIAMLYVLSRKA